MAGRPRGDAAARIDPKTGAVLPEGIRYRVNRDRYQIRVSVSTPEGPRMREVMYKSLAEAKKAKSKADAASFVGSSMTLGTWHDEFWPVIEGSVRPATARGYAVAWRLRVQPSLGSVKLSAITPTMIETAMARWTGSASTKIDALSLLSRLLDAARRGRLVDVNPALDVARPRDEVTEDVTSRALSMDEVTVLLDLIPDGHYRRFAAGLAFTGMRAGELTALRVRDVDFANRVIIVGRSYSPGRNGELILQGTKGRKLRHVPLLDVLRPYAREAAVAKSPNALLFDGILGGRLTGGTFKRAVGWETVRATLGRPDFKVKDLRHTFATMMLDAGVSANDTKDVLGHSSLQVTDIYTRARAGAATRAAAVLDNHLNGPEMVQTHETKGEAKD